MDDYICNNCGHTFEEPEMYEEQHGFAYGPYEKFYVCPACGDSDFEELRVCIRCDTAGPASNYYRDKFCKRCWGEEE